MTTDSIDGASPQDHGEGPVTAADLAALAARFRSGGPLAPPPPRTTDRRPAVHPDLHLVRLRIPPGGRGAWITVDGSADCDEHAAGQLYGSCAAVASDGRVLAAWFPMPAGAARRGVTFAEWEALALGTRLIARYREPVTLIVDNRDVAGEARALAARQKHRPHVVGGNDPQAAGDIAAALASPDVRLSWRPVPAACSGLTALTGPGRAAHALAWVLRRAAYAGIDLAGETRWLSGLAADPPRSQAALMRRWLSRPAGISADPGHGPGG